MIEEALVTILTTPLAASVGDRIYPVPAPQNVKQPYVTYQKISETTEYELAAEAGLGHARVQFNAVAETYSEARTIAALIKSTLSAYQGTVGSIYINWIQHGVDVDLFDEETMISSDYLIDYN